MWNVALLACTAAIALAPLQDPPKTKGPDKEEKLAYPTLEPFVGSRMFKLLAEDLAKIDLAEMAKQVTAIGDAKKTADEAADSVTGLDRNKRPSAELLPKLPAKERPIYALVPLVLIKLQPLWETPAWSDEQVASATQAGTILSKITGTPPLAFKKGEDAHNRADLEKLVRWFDATAAKPEGFAAMIFTMDDGPYVGLPYEASAALPPVETQELDEHLQLRIARVEREGETCVLQCTRDGQPLWSRVLSGEPAGQVKSASFAGVEAKKMGPYGWHVYLRADWTYGVEQGHLYVDPKGQLICYFLSW